MKGWGNDNEKGRGGLFFYKAIEKSLDLAINFKNC